MTRPAVCTVIVFMVMLCSATSIFAGEIRVHGENSTFTAPGVILVWGVLRGSSEDATRVVLRVVSSGSEFGAVSLEGIDPFGGGRKLLLAKTALAPRLDVWTSRATFADVPQREVHLYASPGADTVAFTVFFQGLPDTTPEFDSEAALTRYLDERVLQATQTKR